MKRLDTERVAQLQPERMQYAITEIERLGYKVNVINETTIAFNYKGEKITVFPFSGWHTGKTIADGRGIHNLLKQLV